jgi:CBS-domain-containing membrane protein
MKFDYSPRDCIALAENLAIGHPKDPPELVHYHDSAMAVFTDFNRVRPVTVTPEVAIDTALEMMKNAGVRLLLVTDTDGHMIGLVSADRIMGDRPVRLSRDRRIDRGDITVEMVMDPQSRVKVLERSHLRDAKVGHIVATLAQLEQKHMLVVDHGKVSGLFSATQISRQLGNDILQAEMPAHSLAEMLQTLG